MEQESRFFPPHPPRPFLVSLLFLGSFTVVFSSRVVTLGSIEIYDTHEFLPFKPVVYFRCEGVNKTVLPDVTKNHLVYTFKGEESWQPLTELPEKKCKRCGLYEADTIKPDDVFDEWEFCQSDFVDGKYVRFKEKEFNATFICPECSTAFAGSNQTSSTHTKVNNKQNVAVVIVISVLVSVVVAGGMFAGYRYWQKRKREQDQARFLKLFEDNDDIEDELGLGTII